MGYADPGAADRARQVLSGMRAGDKVLQVAVSVAAAAQPAAAVPGPSGSPTLLGRFAPEAMPKSSPLSMGFGGSGPNSLDPLQGLVADPSGAAGQMMGGLGGGLPGQL